MDDFLMDYIISVYRKPKNYGKLENAHSKSESNPFCGDRIELFVKIENEKISEIKFTGEGCTISIFSAEMLSENFIGKNVNEIKSLSDEDYLKLLPISLTPTRQKCALLSFRIMKNILRDLEKN